MSKTGRGTVTIYDAVANAVIPVTPMGVGADRDLYFVWNGRNREGRRVFPGTYLAVVTAKVGEVAKITRMKIGLK